jgi:CubicO group peptidase (beta-lactamase class C family)
LQQGERYAEEDCWPRLRRCYGFGLESWPTIATRLLMLACIVEMLARPAIAQRTHSSSSTPQYNFAPVRAYIIKTLAETQLPSVSVALAKDGKIIWEEAFGWADREKMIPATPGTVYALASLTKPYASTGVMELVEQHKINLDHPINEYLGSAPLTAIVGDASGATVRRVLCHTSGLPIHSVNLLGNGDQVPPMADTIRRYGVLVNPPGHYFEYSNLGYGALGYMTSLISQLDWKDYMRNKVFLPLGLFHTSVGIGPGLEDDVAARYDNRNRRLPAFAADTPGASSIWSSAHDVVRFGMFQLKDHLPDQRAILTDASLDLMKAPATGGVPSAGTMLGRKSYGLGWFVEPDDHGYMVLSHEGATLGATTTLEIFPSEDLVIVVLINQGVVEDVLVDIVQQIAAAVLPKYAALKAVAPASRQSPSPKSEAQFPLAEFLGSWTGTARTWQGSVPLTITVQPDGDVHVRLGDQLETLLTTVPAFIKDHRLVGMFTGTMPTPDVKNNADKMGLTLSLRDGRLIGEALAFNDMDFDPYAGKPNFTISSYVELAKTSPVK